MANPKKTPQPSGSGLKSESGPNSGSGLAGSLGAVPRTFWFSVIGPLVLLIGGYFAWIQYGAPNLDRAIYGLKTENLIVTPKPPWIDADVTKEVFQGADLGRLSVLDREMSATVFNAFRTHPWIRKVFRVQKISGCQVEINVEYREPLAMIYWEMPNGLQPQNTGSTVRTGGSTDGDTQTAAPKGIGEPSERLASFVPVDLDGVLLPWRDFGSDEVLRYWLIYAKNASTSGRVGADYSDVRVKAALRLCLLLKEHRETLGLERIYVYPSANPDNSPMGSKWILEVTSHNNQRFLWGNPPGMESAGEPNALAKAERLIQLTQRPTSEQSKLVEFDLSKASKSPADSFQ